MSDDRLNEDEARALWRRAAELQAAAEHAASRSRALQPAEGGTLSLEHVTAAAEGAGIDAEYLRVALAEQRLPDAEELRHDHWTARWLRRLIREPHAIERERVIRADPSAVLAAFRSVASGPVYQLTAESLVGDDPVRDGVLVYRGTATGALSGPMMFSDARVLLVTIRAHEQGTLLRIRAPLFRRGLNLLLTGGSAGFFGGGAAAAAGGIATSLGAAAAIAAVPVVIGAGAGGVIGVAAYRRLYRWSRRQGVIGIDQLINAVAAEAASA